MVGNRNSTPDNVDTPVFVNREDRNICTLHTCTKKQAEARRIGALKTYRRTAYRLASSMQVVTVLLGGGAEGACPIVTYRRRNFQFLSVVGHTSSPPPSNARGASSGHISELACNPAQPARADCADSRVDDLQLTSLANYSRAVARSWHRTVPPEHPDVSSRPLTKPSS